VTDALEAARAFRARSSRHILEDFMSLLAIPNVTGHVDDLWRNAEELTRRFEQRGATMEVVALEGASPAVIGELRTTDPTATIGVYVHYDGQPVDPDNWDGHPFRPETRFDDSRVDLLDPVNPEWRIHARGASDDKTPFAALTAALDGLADASIERRIDLVFLFEGEEESGSPNLDRYMTEYAERLRADAWLLCDGPVHQSRRPQIGFGCRGYSGFDLTFYGPDRELHSGHYGNWAPNPAQALAKFLAGCKDEDGRVTIEGFYDDTRPITESDRVAIDRLPDVERQLRMELGFETPDSAWSYGDALMFPTFNVRGLESADVGNQARNVIPATATASVDIRLAAGDDPDRMVERVEAHLSRAGYTVLGHDPSPAERRAGKVAKLIRTPGSYRAVRIPMDSPLARLLLEAAATASGEDVVALPTFGGSIPLYLFEDILEAPVACVPIANHDNNQHAANENVRVANVWYGIDLWSVLLTTDWGSIR
jgi:acetylornithine deacetylase/succinyl-diaminopimelate desuccinylase-like protein